MENLLRTILDHTHVQIAYLDPQFNFVIVNEPYSRGCGYTREQLIGANHFTLFPHAENQAIFERVRDTGESATFSARPFIFPARPELGTTYWDWTLVPIKNEHGAVRGLLLSLIDVTQAERIRQAHDRLQGLLKAVIDNAPGGIVVADAEGRITLTNAAVTRITGCPSAWGQEANGRERPQFCYPDGRPCPEDELPLLRAALHGEAIAGRTLTLAMPGGERRDVLISAAPLTDEDGACSGAVGVLQDMTEENELRRKLQRYAGRLHVLHEADRAIVEGQSIEEIAKAVLDHLSELVPLARASVSLFSVAEGETSFVAVVPDGERAFATGWRGPLAVVWFLGALQRGETYRAERLDCLAHDSSWIRALRQAAVHSFISLPLIAQGELIGSLNLGLGAGARLSGDSEEIIHEIAGELAVALQQARLRAQLQRHADELESLVTQRTEEVRASEERYRFVFDNSVDGILLTAPDGRIFKANAAACRMVGRAEEEICRLGRDSVIDPSDPRLAAALEQRARTGQLSCELSLLHRDGHRIPAEITSALFRDGDGNLRTSMIVRDVTERKRAEAALVQAEKLDIVGRLAASLTHEINNPLQSVLGCLGLAKEALAEGQSADRYLDVALSELRRAADIVSRLRDLQRRPRPHHREPTDLAALVEDALTLTRKKCEDRHISVSWRAQAPLPKLVLARDQIIQVLLNIILNAIDAMPNGGELQLAATPRQEPAGVTLVIADTGEGMDEEILSHLFQAFFTTRSDGVGLGLYVCRNILQDHGGRIEVTSARGRGSTFTIWLPGIQP